MGPQGRKMHVFYLGSFAAFLPTRGFPAPSFTNSLLKVKSKVLDIFEQNLGVCSLVGKCFVRTENLEHFARSDQKTPFQFRAISCAFVHFRAPSFQPLGLEQISTNVYSW